MWLAIGNKTSQQKIIHINNNLVAYTHTLSIHTLGLFVYEFWHWYWERNAFPFVELVSHSPVYDINDFFCSFVSYGLRGRWNWKNPLSLRGRCTTLSNSEFHTLVRAYLCIKICNISRNVDVNILYRKCCCSFSLHTHTLCPVEVPFYSLNVMQMVVEVSEWYKFLWFVVDIYTRVFHFSRKGNTNGRESTLWNSFTTITCECADQWLISSIEKN